MFPRKKFGTKILVVLWTVVVGSLLLNSTQVYQIKPSPDRLSLKDILSGGKPDVHPLNHVLLWTQKRSGSSLTGQLLTASPHTFYTEEPLHDTRTKDLKEAYERLKDIFQCRFQDRPKLYDWWMHGAYNQDINTRMLCLTYKDVCTDATYLDALCKVAWANIVRVVSQDMGVGLTLMKDDALRVRVIHLVRDPRGLVASREMFKNGSHGSFVMSPGFGIPEKEKDPAYVCDRYRRDLAARKEIRKLFPDRYQLVRYEDLALSPEQEVRELHAFMQLPFTSSEANVVALHTIGFHQGPKDHPYTTFKDSKSTAFAWRERVSFEEVLSIQSECRDVLDAYGYRSFSSAEEYLDLTVSPLDPIKR